MVLLYHILLYVHIFSVILTIGPYIALFPMIAKMKTAAHESLPVYLDFFQYVVRVTKHAGHLLVTTGIFLLWLGHWSWFTSWIVATVLVLVSALFFLARAFSPILRALRAPHSDRLKLVYKLQRALIIYLLITMLMLWFMVAKPAFW